MAARDRILNVILPIVGGLIGATIGYYLFFWISRQGFYAMIAPGALMGLGCGLLARDRSIFRGIICGIVGLLLGAFTEWKWYPFVDNNRNDLGYLYMITHLQDLAGIKPVMMFVGAAIAFWLGKDGGYSGTYPRFGSQKPPDRRTDF